MKKIRITYGQDTPAYATKVLSVPDNATPEAMIQSAKDYADDAIEELDFDPSHDWTGLRIVSIDTPDQGCIASHIPIERSGEDLGLVAQNVLSGSCGMMALIHEGERQEMKIAPSVRHLIELGDAMQKASVKDFAPFKLVVESTSATIVDAGPPYAEILMTPARLSRLVMLANVAEKIGVNRMPTGDGVTRDAWGSYGATYMMEDPEITVYPGNNAESGSFVISGRPHNTSDLCESRFINLDTLIDIANGQPIPDGFHREDGVIFYSEGDAEELAEMWRDAQGNDQNASESAETDIQPSM